MHVSVYVCMCTCVYLCTCVSVSMCAGVSAHVCECVCIFGMYDTKSTKCENGVYIYLCVSICLYVSVLFVCGVPNIRLVSVAYMCGVRVAFSYFSFRCIY